MYGSSVTPCVNSSTFFCNAMMRSFALFNSSSFNTNCSARSIGSTTSFLTTTSGSGGGGGGGGGKGGGGGIAFGSEEGDDVGIGRVRGHGSRYQGGNGGDEHGLRYQGGNGGDELGIGICVLLEFVEPASLVEEGTPRIDVLGTFLAGAGDVCT